MSETKGRKVAPFFRVNDEEALRLEEAPELHEVHELPGGVYYAEIRRSFFGQEVRLRPDKGIFNTDGTVNIGGPTNSTLRLVEDFFLTRKERLGGGMNATSIILHGPPGNGKTRAAELAIEWAKNHGAIILRPTAHDRDLDGLRAMKQATQYLRDSDIETPVLWYMDDVREGVWESENVEDFLITSFDGEDMLDNVLFIATTNFGHRLPERFASRASRCMSILFGPPTIEMLVNFFRARNVNDEQLAAYAQAVYGQSLDTAANLLTQVRTLGVDLAVMRHDEAIRRALRDRKLDYSAAMELTYGDLDPSDSKFELPDGRVFNATGSGTLVAQSELDKEAAKERARIEEAARRQMQQFLGAMMGGNGQPMGRF